MDRKGTNFNSFQKAQEKQQRESRMRMMEKLDDDKSRKAKEWFNRPVTNYGK